jgi:predicted metalloprotease
MRNPCKSTLLSGLAVAALALAACGDDETKTVTVGQGTGKNTVVPAKSTLPRYAGDPSATKPATLASVAEFKQLPKQETGNVAPKVRGSDVPIEQFLDTVSNDVASYWQAVFNRSGYKFPTTTSSLVTGQVSTPCGPLDGAAGPPKYCPNDSTIYLPTQYFQEKITPIGDAAIPTDIALLWGYRVQDALGAFKQVTAGRLKPLELNLSAICMAGSYMATVAKRQLLEQGDADEVLNLARATADASQPANVASGRGSPEQRVQAFRIGFSRGSAACQRIRVT